MAPLPHIELADSIPKKPAVKNFYAVWPKFVAIDLWRSGPNWTATMDQSHSAADRTVPRRSSSVCSLTALLRRRNWPQGNSDRHKSMVVESKAYIDSDNSTSK